MRFALLVMVAVLGTVACGDDDDEYGPLGHDGDPGDFCESNDDCGGDLHCCDTDDCEGLCSDYCDDDRDCAVYMACHRERCALICDHDGDCPDGFICGRERHTCAVR